MPATAALPPNSSQITPPSLAILIITPVLGVIISVQRREPLVTGLSRVGCVCVVGGGKMLQQKSRKQTLSARYVDGREWRMPEELIMLSHKKFI